MAEGVGFDLPCGADRLRLQGAPGALPSALGFESHIKLQNKAATPDGVTVCFGAAGGIYPFGA